MIKKEINRHQLRLMCLEEQVGEESIVRVIDAFVDGLDLEELGFVMKGGIKNCLLYTSPSPRDATLSRMPSSA